MTQDPIEDTFNVPLIEHKNLENILDKYTDSSLNCQQIIPGIVAGYADNKKILDVAASGVLDYSAENRDSPQNRMLTTSTFLLWSTTKLLTVTGLFQLIEAGKVSLEDPVEKYLPFFAHKKVALEVDENGEVVKEEELKVVPKIKHLTTHTLGFAYPFFNEKYRAFMEVSQKGGDLLKADETEFVDLPLVFQPGSRWEYGINIDFIGLIIEKITKQTLNDYLKENIFDKCDMKSFSFVRNETQMESWARLHIRDPNSSKNFDSVFHNPDFTPLDPKTHCGGHGCFGSVEDYLRFLQIFINKGIQPKTGLRILKEETILNSVMQDQLPTIGKDVELVDLPSCQPKITNPVSVYPDTPKGWSHFLMITKEKIDLGDGIYRSKNSGMWCGLSNLYYVIDLEKKVVLFWAEQLFPFADPSSFIGFTEFEKFVYKKLKA